MPENEIFLERLRASGGTREEYLSLLPETAAVMGLSCTALQARPVEIQLMLTQTYVNHWNAGRETIQAALQNVTGLDASAERQLQADQTAQMPQQSDAEKMQEERTAQAQRQAQVRQQEAQRQTRRILFSQSLLRQEAARIRQQEHQQQTREKSQAQENQMERTRKNNA